MPELEQLLRRLVDQRVRFVVVGGFAAVAHGCSLLTQDLDICCDMCAENLLRLGEALRGLNPVHRMLPSRPPLVVTPEFCEGIKSLYLHTDAGQLDCLGEVKGIGGFVVVDQVAEEVDMGNWPCRILSLDALIQAKRAMDRPRDREAVLELEAIRERL